MGRASRILGVSIAFCICSGCGDEKPPAPQRPPVAGDDEGAREAAFFEEGMPAVLTYAGERGQLADAQAAADVPEDARGMVRVKLLDGPEAPPGQVWVANLRQLDGSGPDQRVELQTVSRDMFEELAMGQGRSSAVQLRLPEGIDPPEVAAPTQGVIVYKTEWCGVCKQLLAYLDRKGVAYEAKDIEKDPQAAAELQAKARQKGLQTGSVPVIDIGGELMVGFDRARLEKLL